MNMYRYTFNRTVKQYINKICRNSTRNILTSQFPDIELPRRTFPEHYFKDFPKYGNKIALTDGITGQSFTFSELFQLHKNVSSGLTKRRYGRDDVVGLILTNRPEYMFGSLGAMSTGAIVTLCNPLAQAEELAFQLNNSNSRAVITSIDIVDKVKKAVTLSKCVKEIFVIGGRTEGCLSFEDVLMNDKGDASPYGSLEVDAENDVCILPYSSGTTGMPKGVMLTHLNLSSNLNQIKALTEIKEDGEVFLVSLPMFHIYGIMVVSLYGTFRGCNIVTLPKFDPKNYLDVIQRYKVSTLHAVPPLILFLVHSDLVSQYDLSSVYRIMCAAAPLDEKLQEECRKRLSQFRPDIDIFQGYGMTELSPITHLNGYKHLRKPNTFNSVGLLAPNVEAKVITKNGEMAKPGEKGELVVKGPNVLKGYFKNEEATKSSIIDGWFYTGDIMTYDENGFFHIVDRAKELIKYKGFQVAPAELEASLLTHPNILDCGVIGIPDPSAGEVPMAFVVAKGNVTAAEIQEYIAGKVSSYKKLRGGVKFVENIPRSASGKILRKDLRKLI